MEYGIAGCSIEGAGCVEEGDYEMRPLAVRYGAMMLTMLLIAAVPARAGGIDFTQVMQAIADSSNGRPKTELRLRATVQQTGQTPATSTPPSTTTTTQSGTATGTPVGSTTGGSTSIISADVSPATQQEGTIETIELGDVTGTICDCGEIVIPGAGGGFPLWPLLGLGAIPLAFIPGGDNEVPPFNPPPVPTPTTPPNPIPEPATLLLFGSSLIALGAGARRRRAQEATRNEAASIVEEV